MGFDLNLINYFKENLNRNWSDWLEFDRAITKPGKQGLVGLLKLKDDSSIKCVFKVSQYINHLAIHEYSIMKSLNDIAKFCPHFISGLGLIKCDTNPYIRKVGNPFDISEVKYPASQEVLLCEYVDKSVKLFSYIQSEKIHEDILYSTIKQVILSLSIAQDLKKFAHYDLHSNNIMMKRCDPDIVFVYITDNDNQFAVPTLGHYPIIIDYGFSFIEDLNDGPLWSSMAHTCAGFMSDRFDPIADPKLFLVTVSDEVKNFRKSRKSKKLRRIVKNLFHPLSIDWDSGWDNKTETGVSDHVLKILEPFGKNSKLFSKFDHYCIDLIQTLIILPLQDQPTASLERCFVTFLREWCKIEDQMSSEYYQLYILKEVTNAARFVHAAYLDPVSRSESVKEFRSQILASIDKISKFCIPKDLDYEKLLCSLLLLSKSIEGILFKETQNCMEQKEKEYSKLPLTNTLQFFGAIDVNIQDNYIYNPNTKVIFIDAIRKERYQATSIPKNEIDSLNDMHSIVRGSYLYSLFDKQPN